MTQPDPNDSVQLTRTIDAPPYEVYRAFLEPAQLRKWFGPAGFEVANVDVEARVGGRHHTVIAAPDGTRAAFVCEIRELVPGERIVMTFVFEGPESPPDPPETLLTITLGEAAPGSTELTLVHDRLVVPEPEEQDQIREGWAQALDKLESLYTNGGAGMTSTSSPG